jgi:hypothetical protein
VRHLLRQAGKSDAEVAALGLDLRPAQAPPPAEAEAHKAARSSRLRALAFGTLAFSSLGGAPRRGCVAAVRWRALRAPAARTPLRASQSQCAAPSQ